MIERSNGSKEARAACPVCGSSEAASLFTSHNGYVIVRCAVCALVFADDRGAPHESELYPPFDQTGAPWLDGVRGALELFLRQREAFVRSVRPAPARLLDFGCGAGAFARWMSGRGYSVVGLEPYSMQAAPKRSEKLTFVRAPLEEVGDSLGKFDVITMWHVLEHLHTPVDTLQKLVPLLAPGGVLVVSVPNFESLQATLFQGGWFHLDPPRHLIQFEPKTLEDCLSRAGLDVVGERRFLPEYGSSGWLQSTLNSFLPHHNYLYELIKDRGALRGMPKVSSAMHLAASVLAAPPILAVSMVVEAAASSMNRGAALTVAARPRG